MYAIIDYDAGNLKSVQKAFEYLGETVCVTRNHEEILAADKVILPGVGCFGDAMERLKTYDLINTIHKVIERKTPFLGICLGQQLLFEESEESPGVKGLGIIPGKLLIIPKVEGLKVPQIGWNSISFTKNSKLFTGIKEGSYVYFVHSYYCKAANMQDVAATTEYGTLIHAALEHENVYACQFHPEKSGEVGLKILENFSKLS